MSNTDIIAKLRTAMTDAQENDSHFVSWMILNEAICDAVDVLSQQSAQQEPFAWANLNELTEHFNSVNCGTAYRLPGEGRQPLYTTPPAPAEPLTDEQLHAVIRSGEYDSFEEFARAIEAAVLAKNSIKENT